MNDLKNFPLHATVTHFTPLTPLLQTGVQNKKPAILSGFYVLFMFLCGQSHFPL